IQFLVKISTDLGLPEREIYENELKKVNKMKEIQLQRKTSADKSRNIVKGRKISQVENDGSHSKHDDNRQLSGRKRAPIDLDHTEGVFSQQEPVAVPSFVNQLSQDMTGGRPRTAILKKDQNKSLFDENDDAAELLP
ncbi:unnamed protein product, partial [Rotaria sordida]